MGAYLCFPLLCCQNYAAFRWCVGAEAPVLINGDDIVFRARKEVYDRWADFVGRVGLKLSVGKTMVSGRFFSLNSTFFRSSPRGVSLIPVVRFGWLTDRMEYADGFGQSMYSFLRGFSGKLRRDLETVALRAKGRDIRRTGRSLTTLGWKASYEALLDSGLLLREKVLLDAEAPFRRCPGGIDESRSLPTAPWRVRSTCRMDGWRRKKLGRYEKPDKEVQQAFFRKLVACCWEGVEVREKQAEHDYWSLVRATGLEFVYTSRLGKRKATRRRQAGLFRGLPVRSKVCSREFWRIYAEKEKGRVRRAWVFEGPVEDCEPESPAYWDEREASDGMKELLFDAFVDSLCGSRRD